MRTVVINSQDSFSCCRRWASRTSGLWMVLVVAFSTLRNVESTPLNMNAIISSSSLFPPPLFSSSHDYPSGVNDDRHQVNDGSQSKLELLSSENAINFELDRSDQEQELAMATAAAAAAAGFPLSSSFFRKSTPSSAFDTSVEKFPMSSTSAEAAAAGFPLTSTFFRKYTSFPEVEQTSAIASTTHASNSGSPTSSDPIHSKKRSDDAVGTRGGDSTKPDKESSISPKADNKMNNIDEKLEQEEEEDDNAIRVAYQGEPGAYSECATRELLGSNVVAVGLRDFESCFRAVASHRADYTSLPIENSLGGSIHENYDLMLRYDLHIVAEHEYRVRHCLLVRNDSSSNKIKYAISHPQALAQCANYLRKHGIVPVKAYDTSGSAKMLAAAPSPQSSLVGVEAPHDLEPMTAGNTCAIASDLAGRTYGLACREAGIEDDDSNFTRFLLLGRRNVSRHLTGPSITVPSLKNEKATSGVQQRRMPAKAKTSVVFTLPNAPGALYKALACFSLRDIDFSKIESRPTPSSLLGFLKYRAQQQAAMTTNSSGEGADGVGTSSHGHAQLGLPRFRYCFYLDFLANELDPDARNALHHLREQADFCRVLGCYPQKSRLVGPVREAVERMELSRRKNTSGSSRRGRRRSSKEKEENDNGDVQINQECLKVGVVIHRGGRGRDRSDDCDYDDDGTSLGTFLSRKLFEAKRHDVSCVDLSGGLYAQSADIDDDEEKDHLITPVGEDDNDLLKSILDDKDVVVLCVGMLELPEVASRLRSIVKDKLVVQLCPLGMTHPKSILLNHLPSNVDVVCGHAMFEPPSSQQTIPQRSIETDDQPFVYEKVRLTDPERADLFLETVLGTDGGDSGSSGGGLGCRMIEMSAEQHDRFVADSEFTVRLVGQMLMSSPGDATTMPTTPVSSQDFAWLQRLADRSKNFANFYDIYQSLDGPGSPKNVLQTMERNLAEVGRRLAAEEAYRRGVAERNDDDRRKLLAECKGLLRDVVVTTASLGDGAGKGTTPTSSTKKDRILSTHKEELKLNGTTGDNKK